MTLRSRGTESSVVSFWLGSSRTSSIVSEWGGDLASMAPLLRLSEPISNTVCGPPVSALASSLPRSSFGFCLRASVNALTSSRVPVAIVAATRRRGDHDQTAEEHAPQ